MQRNIESTRKEARDKFTYKNTEEKQEREKKQKRRQQEEKDLAETSSCAEALKSVINDNIDKDTKLSEHETQENIIESFKYCLENLDEGKSALIKGSPLYNSAVKSELELRSLFNRRNVKSGGFINIEKSYTGSRKQDARTNYSIGPIDDGSRKFIIRLGYKQGETGLSAEDLVDKIKESIDKYAFDRWHLHYKMIGNVIKVSSSSSADGISHVEISVPCPDNTGGAVKEALITRLVCDAAKQHMVEFISEKADPTNDAHQILASDRFPRAGAIWLSTRGRYRLSYEAIEIVGEIAKELNINSNNHNGSPNLKLISKFVDKVNKGEMDDLDAQGIAALSFWGICGYSNKKIMVYIENYSLLVWAA